MPQSREDFQDTYPTDFQSSRQAEQDIAPTAPTEAEARKARQGTSVLEFLRELLTYRFR